LALLCALLLGGCDAEVETPVSAPKLVFTQVAYDFGRVAQGTPVEHRFPFANAGGSDLTVITLRVACDCAATLEGGRDVAPFGSGVIRGRFDTNAVYGPQRWTITVYSNDPEQRAIMLTVTGEVALDVAADPPQVYLGVVPPGVALVRGVTLRSGNPAVTIGAPKSDAPQLALRLGDAADGSDAAAVLAIGTSSSAPRGPFSAVVELPTSSPAHPVLRIAVAGVIDPAAPTPRPFGPQLAPDSAATPPTDG
jgi:hypothetical protein